MSWTQKFIIWNKDLPAERLLFIKKWSSCHPINKWFSQFNSALQIKLNLQKIFVVPYFFSVWNLQKIVRRGIRHSNIVNCKYTQKWNADGIRYKFTETYPKNLCITLFPISNAFLHIMWHTNQIFNKYSFQRNDQHVISFISFMLMLCEGITCS